MQFFKNLFRHTSTTLPPVEETGCSAAFLAARDEVRQLRSFSAPTLQIMEQLAQVVIAPNELTPRDAAELNGVGTSIDMINGINTYTKLSSNSLNEKLASDIAWDLGLPHVSYALIRNNQQDYLTLCIEPAPAARALDEVETVSLPNFIISKPHLAPALSALAVFDYWLYVHDRHQGNLVVHPKAEGTGECLTGIDLNRTRFHEGWRHEPYSGIVEASRLIEGASSRSAAEAALVAIETYPSQRIAELSSRLLPHAGVDTSKREVIMQAPEVLLRRRNTLRADAARLFPKLQLDRKVFSAPTFAA